VYGAKFGFVLGIKFGFQGADLVLIEGAKFGFVQSTNILFYLGYKI